ncbi:Histidine kinase [Dyadobacter koreensis]|uniref:histidine kinase n=1 Tax=Dyadobacter koreensis TaxID=408657 RepID=A0A1H6R385_9BACT|nr:ATP-binding protein [Dyadobacter koreensis]SEI46065.1 Histidine kinase [Dyadobacter koreensis]
MPDKISESVVIVVAGTILILLLLVFLLTFFFIFQRRHLQHQTEKAQLHAKYAQEILLSQIEVQNSTLQQIAQELHDNIGQLLSVAKINLNILEDIQKDTDAQPYITQTNDIIGSVISDIRSLTKSFDGDFVKDFGLEDSMIQELNRIKKTNKYFTEFITEGEKYSLGYEKDIILFRIFQELLNNCLKHAVASQITLQLHYHKNSLEFQLKDNGQGFTPEQKSKSILNSGAGLRNVQRRAELIHASFAIDSAPGKGTLIIIKLPR